MTVPRAMGDEVNKKMELSEFGEFVETEIRKIPEYNPRIILDEWQVMPNHIHLIIELGEYNYNNGIANVDDDNVIENGNAADGGNVVGCGNTNATNATAQPSMVVQSRLQTNQ